MLTINTKSNWRVKEMFIINNLAQLEKAASKARQIKPILKIIEFGKYVVKGSNGNFYTVKCYRNGNQRIIECECKAGERGFICYHGCSALEAHGTLAKYRQTAII